jgi:hypothetical protein
MDQPAEARPVGRASAQACRRRVRKTRARLTMPWALRPGARIVRRARRRRVLRGSCRRGCPRPRAGRRARGGSARSPRCRAGRSCADRSRYEQGARWLWHPHRPQPLLVAERLSARRALASGRERGVMRAAGWPCGGSGDLCRGRAGFRLAPLAGVMATVTLALEAAAVLAARLTGAGGYVVQRRPHRASC